jgi:hypothetical protein
MFMPARGISRRATDSGSPRYPLLALILLFASPFVCAQQQSQGQPPQQQQSQQQGTVIPSPPPPPQAQTDQGHHIKQNVDMVVVHATVTDDKGEFISDLGQDNFRVYEDRIEQRISVFTHQDVPVTMGLVIDNSGSMREKRSQVNAAALSFVKTSNPQDKCSS